jgi:two-component system CheB/CheR fusion protein
VDVLKLQSSLEDTVQWARDVIDRQIRHLTHLVNDLLDVARITQGRIVLYQQRVNLAEVITRAIEATQPLIDTHQHRLILALPASPLILEGDPNRLVQVVANLLSNAAKYTNPGGRIWLTAQQEANDILLQVRDTGIGISSEMLPFIFDLFTQTKRSLDRSQGGLGLGLTLVRRLVEMHGGRVQAFSAGPDQGSEFVVRLPALAGAFPPTDQTQNARKPEGQWPIRRILVVEDNHDIAQSLVKLLSALGHKVSAVSNGAAALETVRTFRPEVVFLDIGLPGMDGYTVARHLRKEYHQTLRLVALTGYGQDEDRRRAREAGFDHHLLKPVTVDVLQAVLMAITRS